MKDFQAGENTGSIVSVTDKVRQVNIGAPVTSVQFLGDNAAFVGAEENVYLVNVQGDVSRVAVHSSGILCATTDGTRIVMGGDDGKLVSLDASGEVKLLATDAKRRWIDNVALHPDGAVAWSAGKTAFIRGGTNEEKSFDAPSTVGGLAFAPKGLRLAVAHYNGVTLWFPNMTAKPEVLEWAGSHLAVTFSPARAGAARLAARRCEAHAQDRLSGTGPVAVVERRGKGAGHLRCGYRDHVAVRRQGWADGQGARDAGSPAGSSLDGGMSSEAGHPRCRLWRRHGPAGASG